MVNPYPFHNAKKGQREITFTRNHKIFMAVLFLGVSKTSFICLDYQHMYDYCLTEDT